MIRLSIVAAAALLPQAALAHPGHAHDHPHFLQGLFHPLAGADHLLAMVAIGLLAAQHGSRAAWSLPPAFMAAMGAGAMAGAAAPGLPGVEPAILASVMALGALLAVAARPPLAVLLALMAAFGAAHGLAHGAEGPATGLPAYAAGFLLATAALHGAGLWLGGLLWRGSALRALGGAIGLAGITLAVAG